MGTRTSKGEYGLGSIYLRARDNRWVGTLEAGWNSNGTRRRVHVTAKTEAEVKRRLRDRRRQLEQGQVDQSSRVTVKAWSASWLEITQRTDAPKTHSNDMTAVRLWIVPTIGHRQLGQLTPKDVRDVAGAQRAAGRKSSTALRTHSVLMQMLKAAVQEGHTVPERVLAVKPPAVGANDREVLVQLRIRVEVNDLRELGWSWAAIGDQFGISRQAAQQRFGYGYEPPRAAR